MNQTSKQNYLLIFIVAVIASCTENTGSKLPNVMIIYADDMGYRDLNIQYLLKDE